MEIKFHPAVDRRLHDQLTKMASKFYYGDGPPRVSVRLPDEEPPDYSRPGAIVPITMALRTQDFEFEPIYRFPRSRFFQVGILVKPV